MRRLFLEQGRRPLRPNRSAPCVGLTCGCGRVVAMAALLVAGVASATEADLARMAWLAGCWRSDNAEAGSGEQWTHGAGGTMFGIGRTVKSGKTVAYEFMQLRDLPDGTLAFVAQPSGNPPTPFPLVRIADGEAVFENPTHDFPQRVVYALEGGAKLRARIEGLRGGALRVIEFPMSRVSCDTPSGAPAK